ncbi:UDP-glucosyltransferase 29-like [Salvia miltiorrhiza]|uniref:UDP-glucosyltransferase 29-like n=1 Tax=Salvia miltiorrhiza TaxID=226208 RepID=UPI0025AC5944|nr:UDP-glucosyltransferase 29-like [Salvia miltiorrhiza]
MMDAKQSDLRVLMFPWLAHGHVFPFLELAKGLAKKHFHIYFCSTPINLDSVKNHLNNNNNNNNNNDDADDHHASIELVELHLPSLPELPPHYHTTKNTPPDLIPTLMEAFQESGPAFSDIIGRLEPDLLIYDVMQPWAAKAAASRGVPPVYFSTSGATTFALAHHLYTHKNWDSFPHEAIRLKDYEKRGMGAAANTIRIKDAGEGFVFGVFHLSNDVVLMKTCRGLEGKYVDYLSNLCERKIVTTGPLITFADNQETGGSEIMEWLSEREESSTLYISFGSENYLTKEQMREIAKGLELSGVNFIWVAREPAGSEVSLEDAVPEGFLERAEPRGLVVRGWAPQAAILAHPSVGGFMSHCGWSSITESLYFGVPVVALPLKLDQPMNARLVVEAGVGVDVARDEEGELDGGRVAEAVKEVLMGESGERLRSRAREMSGKMKMEGDEAFDEIAEELIKICNRK